MRSKWQEERKQDKITEAAPNELNLGEGVSSDGSWPSATRWRRGGFVRRPLRQPHRRFGVFECRRTHTHFEYPLGKPLEAKLLKELSVSIMEEMSGG